MVNYFIYAKDFSGSTRGNVHYHTNGLKSFEQFKSDVEKIKNELSVAGEPLTDCKIIYLHWGDMCYEVNESVTIETYQKLQCGNMCTKPGKIIEWIRKNYNICDGKNKIKLLYIITDGMVDEADAEVCFKLNENMDYESVVFHAFNQNLENIDMSVAASFFKNRCKVYRNYEIFDNVDISEEFDYGKINIDNFDAEKDNLRSYIKLKYIGKMTRHDRALQEVDKLKKLRNQLFAEFSSKPKTEINFDTKDRNEFWRRFKDTDWYKGLIGSDQDRKTEIEKFFSTLINYIVSEKKSFSFDALKFDRKFNNPIVEEPIAEVVDLNFAAEQEIEFPDIILDDEKGIPVIILTEFSLLDKIIFHKTKKTDEVSPASFSKFKSAMECPLFLLKDADFKTSIGYFYTLNVFKQLLANTTRTEPRTRRPFHGGLVLTDTDLFDKYNDYILAATYFDFKKINYNTGLLYYVLWKNCENKEWMDRNVVEQFKKYTMRRISETKCKIALSSLPLDPPQNTSLLAALWYCTEMSSCIFKNDPRNFMHERLRMYYGVAHCMIEILQFFNYNLDLYAIEKRIDIMRHVMILITIKKYEEKVYFLLKNIFKTEKGFLVCEIEKPANLNKLNYLKLNHKDMLCEDIINGKIHLNEYVHLLHSTGDLRLSKDSKTTFRICEKTFRPYFVIDELKSFYTGLLSMAKKVIINNDDDKDKINIDYESINTLEFGRILSLYNLFIKCVQTFNQYPTFEEYVEYISNKKKYRENLVTIFPPNTYFDAKHVYEVYQNIMTKVDVNTFIEVTKKYVTRVKRIKAEGIMQFNNDNEIATFVSSEDFTYMNKPQRPQNLQKGIVYYYNSF